MNESDLLSTILVWIHNGVRPRDVWPLLAGMAIPDGVTIEITWGHCFDLMRDWQLVLEVSPAREVA